MTRSTMIVDAVMAAMRKFRSCCVSVTGIHFPFACFGSGIAGGSASPSRLTLIGASAFPRIDHPDLTILSSV